MYEDALARVAASHFSVVELEDLAETPCWGTDGRLHKFGKTRVRNLLRNGRLVRVYQGVYRLAGTVETTTMRLYAAIVAAGTWAVASHRSALALHHLAGGDRDIIETVAQRHKRKAGPTSRPNRRRLTPAREGTPPAYVHETRRLDEQDFMVVDGIPVTTVARTLCDAGVSVLLGHIEAATLELAIQDALRRDLTSLEQLGETFERLGGTFRPGGKEFEAALARFIPQMTRSQTTAELQLVSTLRDNGYEVETQKEVWIDGKPIYLDVFIPLLGVAPEFDSYRWHGGRLRFDRDGKRTIQLARIGILRLPVTDAELDAGCPELLATLAARKAALAQLAA